MPGLIFIPGSGRHLKALIVLRNQGSEEVSVHFFSVIAFSGVRDQQRIKKGNQNKVEKERSART